MVIDVGIFVWFGQIDGTWDISWLGHIDGCVKMVFFVRLFGISLITVG